MIKPISRGANPLDTAVLSSFRANEVRLQLSVLAYNLGNSSRPQ